MCDGVYDFIEKLFVVECLIEMVCCVFECCEFVFENYVLWCELVG